ncbi:MAG: hypothetical protein QM710_09840 [Flavobacterium sp.]
MLGLIALLLLVLPFILQIILGTHSIDGMAKIRFRYICLITVALQILFSYIEFSIFDHNFKKSTEDREIVCGMPYVGIILLILLVAALLTLTIIIQSIVKLIQRKNSGGKFDKFRI